MSFRTIRFTIAVSVVLLLVIQVGYRSPALADEIDGDELCGTGRAVFRTNTFDGSDPFTVDLKIAKIEKTLNRGVHDGNNSRPRIELIRLFGTKILLAIEKPAKGQESSARFHLVLRRRLNEIGFDTVGAPLPDRNLVVESNQRPGRGISSGFNGNWDIQRTGTQQAWKVLGNHSSVFPGTVRVAVVDSGTDLVELENTYKAVSWSPKNAFAVPGTLNTEATTCDPPARGPTEGLNLRAGSTNEVCKPGTEDLEHGTDVANMVLKGQLSDGQLTRYSRIKIFPIKIISPPVTCASHAIAAWDAIININLTNPDEPINIVNNSFGFREPSNIEIFAVNEMRMLGILMVGSAGYGRDLSVASGNHYRPATISNDIVIGVAAASMGDIVLSDSSFGEDTIDLAAPGEYNATPTGIFGGTSAATGLVSGAAALINIVCDGESASGVAQRLRDGATPIDTSGTNRPIKYGRLNTCESVRACFLNKSVSITCDRD
ncbi:MAG: S8 family serine peptidase [Pyrinomonadaceae bacterium]|nr:S8 family serine peptidase [Pyrinomonadaceae bacterium]